jgi:hypothetical protein
MGKRTSDAGGVAARVGFKYQDHVAAKLVLQMIGDRRIIQVECETSDDVTVKWRVGTTIVPEYVQVKTTDKDTKWTTKELTTRTTKGVPSSLIEKSLLTDAHEANARFRIVARRGLAKHLTPLTDPLDLRGDLAEIEPVARALQTKWPKTKSANGNDLEYWGLHAVWDVLPIEHINHANLQSISRLAEGAGANPSHSHAMRIYDDLLRLVEEAASATRRTPDDKIITREAALSWWGEHLADTSAAQKQTSKPYRTRGDKFFAEIHTVTESDIKRAATGYDAQYERKVWRAAALAEYLVRWLPEVTLRASELVEIDQLNLRQKLEAALKAVRAQRALDVGELIGQLLLHAVLRHYFGTEPIACKLFYQSVAGNGVAGAAHIRQSPMGDELWLGRAQLISATDRAALTAGIDAALAQALSPAILSEERDIILQLREPQHLSNNDLGDALETGAPVDALIKVLCLPLLFVYDSAVLIDGYADDYQKKLITEVEGLYSAVKNALPADISAVQVHVFLVPVESFSVLTQVFTQKLESL